MAAGMRVSSIHVLGRLDLMHDNKRYDRSFRRQREMGGRVNFTRGRRIGFRSCRI
jgi:hypothetical protein